jgi:hypothetical protein
MLVAARLRERVYYVAFAREFKQAKVFCAPIVPCEHCAALDLPSHVNSIAIQEEP